MSARATCRYALVGFLFLGALVLLPGSEGNSIELLKYNHLNANKENQLEYIIQNPTPGELDYELDFSVYSLNRQEALAGVSVSRNVALDSYLSDTVEFPFTIPTSGEYEFRLQATISNGSSSWQEEVATLLTFREFIADLPLEEYARLDYDASIDNGFWDYDDTLQLVGGDGSQFATGAVLGPFDTSLLRGALLHLEHTATPLEGDLRISYALDYDPQNRYSTEWHDLLLLPDELATISLLELPEAGHFYLRFYAACASGDCGWEITAGGLSGVKRWHDLAVTAGEYTFLGLESSTTVEVTVENRGIYAQELGNISARLAVYEGDTVAEETFQSIAIEPGETRVFSFTPTLPAPGIYRSLLLVELHDSRLYSNQQELFLGHSATTLTPGEDTAFSRAAVLLDAPQLPTAIPYIWHYSFGDRHVLEIESEYLDELASSSNVLAAVSLDAYGVALSTLLPPVTVENNWPVFSAEMTDRQPLELGVSLINTGFYTENFVIEYHYSPLFLASVSGPSTALIAPGTIATIPVTIMPHASIPQPGSSPVTVTVRLPGVGISEYVTLLLDYREPGFEASEIRLDRHSLLAGQEIRGKLALFNDGFPADGLRAEVVLLAPSGAETRLWNSNIEELGHGEEFSASFSHAAQQGGLFQLRLEVYQQDVLLYSALAGQDFRVVAGDGEELAEPPALEIPRPALNMLALLSFLGLAFYTASSENSRYLSFKLFLPLYTRLRRDTLADEPTRQNLMRYIYVHPGANFTQLRDHFDLHNGTLSHHLNVLENHSVIESFRAGRQRLFYPCRAELTGVVARPLVTSEVQQQIVMLIKDEPGITQSMIATRLDMSRQKVNYHVNALTRQALIRVERSGRITRLFPLHFT